MPETVSIEGGEAEFMIQFQKETGRQIAMIEIIADCSISSVCQNLNCFPSIRVDTDLDYKPVADDEGYCYILAPFSQ